MAVTTYWFAKGFLSAFNKEVDFNAGAAIKATQHTSTYVPNQDTHDYYDDLTNELSTAGGYTAGGLTLTTPAVTTTLNVAKLDSDDPVWTSSGAGITSRIIVLRDATSGVSTTDPLILWTDFGADETASGGGTFTYQVNAGGWATITAADAAGFP